MLDLYLGTQLVALVSGTVRVLDDSIVWYIARGLQVVLGFQKTLPCPFLAPSPPEMVRQDPTGTRRAARGRLCSGGDRPVAGEG